MNAAEFARKRARIARSGAPSKKRQRGLAHLLREAKAALVIHDRKVIGYRLPNGEMVCIKERYRTEHDATVHMERIQAANRDGQRVPQRVYACANCHGWHLTSRAKLSA